MDEYHLIIIDEKDGHTWLMGGMTLDEIKEYVKTENIDYTNYSVIKGEMLKDFKMMEMKG
jgi:hypothetical protein